MQRKEMCVLRCEAARCDVGADFVVWFLQDRRRRLTEAVDPECTFRPQINSRRAGTAGVHVGDSSSSAFDRLYALVGRVYRNPHLPRVFS
jgi:hypothetical protein